MKQIPLTKTSYALVDDEDYELISQYAWLYLGRYAITAIDQKPVSMHRMIMGYPKGKVVDHRNNDGLDNRRENLRICTYSQNAKSMIANKSLSGYRGVSWNRISKKWEARLRYNGKHMSLGLFDNPRHAALARDLWASDVDGEYARLNFVPAI